MATNENELYIAQVERDETNATQPRWAVFQYQAIWAGVGRSARVSDFFWTEEDARAELVRIDARINAAWKRRVALVVGGMVVVLVVLLAGVVVHVIR